jgi:deoxyribose-phosphate aldolase
MDPNVSQAPGASPEVTALRNLTERIFLTALDPSWSDSQVESVCRDAIQVRAAGVVVRPSDVEMAAGLLSGSPVGLCAAAAFPHGLLTTASKLYEIRELLRRGAREVALSTGAARLVSRQFQEVELELMQAVRICRDNSAKLTVVAEPGWLTDDLQVILCRIAKRAEVDCLQFASGFGPRPATHEEIARSKRLLGDYCLVSAGSSTLDETLSLAELGCARVWSSNGAAILLECSRRLELAGSQASAG